MLIKFAVNLQDKVNKFILCVIFNYGICKTETIASVWAAITSLLYLIYLCVYFIK